MRKGLIVTIDGPSGSGKSTMARLTARALGYRYIDTGAMYRGVAYAFLHRKTSESLDTFLKNLSIRFDFGEETKVFLDDVDISREIRDPEVSNRASELSRKPQVRQYLTGIQRAIGREGGVVLEGRDTGSVVFPDADIKFYLDADLLERAERRRRELDTRGQKQDVAIVRDEMARRDDNDSSRNIAPLIVPEGAFRLDTTAVDVEQVLAIILRRIREASP
jgi:CMP/dCMP kinase